MSLWIVYQTVWSNLPKAYVMYEMFYSWVFTDMSFYYMLLIVASIMILLMSGILVIGMTIKFGQLLGDLLL